MFENPYQPPEASPPPPRTLAVTVAAFGAWGAASYWALLTAMIALGSVSGSVSSVQALLPLVMVGMYAWRGWQLFDGNVLAARNLVVLHAIGGIVAITELTTGPTLVRLLFGLKLAIHVFGLVASIVAVRSPRS